MKCVVTGAAGFIGSHLAEALVRSGHRVVGIDSFTDYYPKSAKLGNISGLKSLGDFKLVQGNLNDLPLGDVLGGAELIFHLAAQPGVRPSWGTTFRRYVDDNIMATQALLESCKGLKLKKLVFASSSSVYGDAESLPTSEDQDPRPVSPYGATKLAAENLCRIYHKSFGVPTVVLRYFTVYGPRQRPDMAFNRFIRAISKGKPIEVFGDGSQLRDFTFVSDVVRATILASKAPGGSLFNVGGGAPHRLSEAIDEIASVLHREPKVRRMQAAPGDVRGTSADITGIRRLLGWEPTVSLRHGLEEQVEWQLRGHSKK